MTISGLPYNDCDCCGYGFDIAIDQLVLTPPVVFPTCSVPTKCNDLSGIAQYWELVVPVGTITGCTGTRCTAWEGIFILAWTSGCTWRSPVFTAARNNITCTPVTNARWDMQHSTSNGTTLSGPFLHGGGGFWSISNAAFDCLGPNTLVWNGGTSGVCTSSGASLTIEPAFGP